MSGIICSSLSFDLIHGNGFNVKANIKGIAWFIASLIVSVTNDFISKHLTISGMTAMQITFWRFFLGTLILLIPFCCFSKIRKETLRGLNIQGVIIHIARGLCIFIAIYLWNFGIGLVPLATVTTIGFVTPIFALILAPLFLKERVSLRMFVLTVAGFIGVIFILGPYQALYFQPSLLIFVFATLLFAMLDVVNKKLVMRGENNFRMIIGSTLVGALCAVYPGAYLPNIYEFLALIELGVGCNAVLYCLLKSFSYLPLISLAPLRYIELLLSITLGYFVFEEVLQMHWYIGSLIIVVSSFCVIKENAVIDAKFEEA